MRKRMIATIIGVLAIAAIACAAPVTAADYPKKPIHMLVGFRAGGGVDTMARIVAEVMSEELGQPVVVQNKAGGGGNLMCASVFKAKADGYTIGVAPSVVFAFNPLAMKTRYKTSDFKYLGMGARFQDVFAANPDKGWKDMKEMIEWAKKNGKKLRYASVSPLDMAITKAISKKTGVPILPMPTKGTAESLTNILGGHVDFGFSGGPHYSYVKADRMMILVGLGSEPPAAFQEVKTLKDLGYEIVVEDYLAIVGPKSLPDDITATLEKAIEKAFTSDKFKDVVSKMKLEVKYQGQKEATRIMNESETAMKAIVN